MRTITLAEKIGRTAQARRNARNAGNDEWAERWNKELDSLEEELPSGSGLDSDGMPPCGLNPMIDRERSGLDRIVFRASFHHLNEVGMYDGWTEHEIHVRPNFLGLDIRVTGRNRNDIKEYLAELFDEALSRQVPEYSR